MSTKRASTTDAVMTVPDAKSMKGHTEGYDPTKSTTSPAALEAWIQKPISGCITEVPGIGEKNKTLLGVHHGAEEPICTTHQLLGKFLMCKGREGASGTGDMLSQMRHCDAFWQWLKERNITHCRNSIVESCAAKCNAMIPGIYDEENTSEHVRVPKGTETKASE